MSTIKVNNIQNTAGVDQFGNLEAVSGYQKLPGGLIIQWGTCAAGSNIAFAMAFPTACLMCIMTTDTSNAASGNIANSYFHLSSTSTTGATRTNTIYPAKFIAFGY